MTVWRVEAEFFADKKGLETLLDLGWEPFAVTQNYGDEQIWLRKRVETDD